MALKDKSQIVQGGRGICGFACMSQVLVDFGKITLKDYQTKYGDGNASATQVTAIKFTQEWMDKQIAHDAKLKKEQKLDFTATSLKQSLMFTEDFGADYKYTVSDLEKGNWKGLGLVPEAITQYLNTNWKLGWTITIYKDNNNEGADIAKLWKSTSDNLGNGIYGIKRKKGTKGALPSNQITHYVYIDKAGNLMTWGI